MIKKLKEETRELHERIEDQNLAKQIMDHTIDLETYKLLLLQNYLAYRETEAQIKRFLPDYPAKKHLQLHQDLEHLGVPVNIPVENVTFECNSKAEAIGAAYVVEGSALGGLVLAKNIQKCENLNHVSQHHFFNGDKENLKDWNYFRTQLEEFSFTEQEERQALEKAKATFLFFENIFQRRLEVA